MSTSSAIPPSSQIPQSHLAFLRPISVGIFLGLLVALTIHFTELSESTKIALMAGAGLMGGLFDGWLSHRAPQPPAGGIDRNF